MTIGSTTANSISPLEKKHQHQKPQEIEDLESALTSGDLTAAKRAFSTIQDKLKRFQSQSGGLGGNSSNPFATDLAAIGKALDSGNIASAQSAFTKMETNAKAHRAGHHHPTPAPSDPLAESAGSTLSISA